LTGNRIVESPGDRGGWFVSSYTNGGGACVEVKFAGPGMILVRDSKDRRDERPIMGMPSGGWAALLGSITK
jgi:uncharacterized protein DUF397